MISRFQDTAEKAARRLISEPDGNILSILVTGSVFDGSAKDDSDVDLCVLWSENSSLRRPMLVEGVEIDIFCDGVKRIWTELFRAQQRFIVWMYAHASVIYDPFGIGSQLMSEAVITWGRGRKPPTKQMLFRQHCEAVDSLRTIKRIEDRKSVV